MHCINQVRNTAPYCPAAALPPIAKRTYESKRQRCGRTGRRLRLHGLPRIHPPRAGLRTHPEEGAAGGRRAELLRLPLRRCAQTRPNLPHRTAGGRAYRLVLRPDSGRAELGAARHRLRPVPLRHRQRRRPRPLLRPAAGQPQRRRDHRLVVRHHRAGVRAAAHDGHPRRRHQHRRHHRVRRLGRHRRHRRVPDPREASGRPRPPPDRAPVRAVDLAAAVQLVPPRHRVHRAVRQAGRRDRHADRGRARRRLRQRGVHHPAQSSGPAHRDLRPPGLVGDPVLPPRAALRHPHPRRPVDCGLRRQRLRRRGRTDDDPPAAARDGAARRPHALDLIDGKTPAEPHVTAPVQLALRDSAAAPPR